MTLLEAARTGVRWMRWWLEHGDCECDVNHSCGLNERRLELSDMEKAVVAAEEAEWHSRHSQPVEGPGSANE